MDERPLLPSCLAQLERIGVERIVVRDGGSTDGSLEWLRARAGERLRIDSVGDDEKRDPVLCAFREAEAARAIGADWVLFLDADEFWLPAAGRLDDGAQWRDLGLDLLQVPRFNVALGPEGPLMPDPPLPAGYAATWLFARPIPRFRQHLADHPGTPWISGVPVPKFAARPEALGRIEPGWHGARDGDGQPLRRASATGLLIAHLPFTDAARFRQKVDNIRRLFDADPGCFAPDQGWHWRRWAALPDEAAVAAEFARQCLDRDEIDAMRRDGSLRDAASLLGLAVETP